MGTCQSKQNILSATMKAGEKFVVHCQAVLESLPHPMSSYDVKVELRLGGVDGLVLATWTKADPEITFEDSIGETTLTIGTEETLALAANPEFDGLAFIDFLFTKLGDGWRSDPVQISLWKGITQ